MYRKMKLRRLVLAVIILLVLVGSLLLRDYFKGDRSYRSFVLTIDTTRIASITISTAIPNPAVIKLILTENKWKVIGNGITYSADPEIMKNVIADLSQLKIEILAAKGKNSWPEFQVNDSSAIKVSIEERGKKENKLLFIGKFSYQQPSNPYERQGRISTFVRLGGEDETYSVQGFLRMSFAPEINNFRNRFLVKSNSELFSKLTFTYPGDSSFAMTKTDNKWKIEGVPVDSAKSASFFADIERISSYDFADTVKHTLQPVLTLKIEGPTLTIPIELNGYRCEYGNGYLVHSSYNPEALFNGSLQNLASKIFKGKRAFFK